MARRICTLGFLFLAIATTLCANGAALCQDEGATRAESSRVATTASGDESKTPIAPSGRAISRPGAKGVGSTVLTTFGSLALALCVFFGLLAIARYLTGRSRGLCASHEIEIVERIRFDAKSELVAIKWRGQSILAVANSNGWRALARDVANAADVEDDENVRDEEIKTV